MLENGVVGVTDGGRPIVREDYCCPHWAAGGGGLSAVRECWYCRYADFRKRTDVTLSQSVCRCPFNRAGGSNVCGNERMDEGGF